MICLTTYYLTSLVYMFWMYQIAQCLVKSDLMFKLLLPFCVFCLSSCLEISVEAKLLEISQDHKIYFDNLN